MSAKELEAFYIGRAKKPDLFTYDEDGNLVELNREGSIVKTFPLPDYRVPTYEEFDTMEKDRLEAIAAAQKVYDDTRRELRQRLEAEDVPKSEVLRLNRAAREADIKLLAARFPLLNVEVEGSVEINKIDFTKSFEKRKYPYNFYFLKERPFTLQQQYVRIGKEPKKPLTSVAEARAAEDSAIQVVLFSEPETNDYGFLSLKWVVELEFNGTMYNSAQQAVYAEIAKSFNDQEGLQRIMLADTPNGIHYELSDVPGEPDANEARWNDMLKRLIYDVNILKFNQYPELAGRLLETKAAALGAYIPDDNLLGIGISLDNIQSKNPIHWTGQNLLGKALMEIRDKIRAEREVTAVPTEADASKPVPRRKKPVAAPPSQPPTAAADGIVPAEAVAPPPVVAVPEVAVAPPPPAGQRPIRRKPMVAAATASVAPSAPAAPETL
jgi:ribA/ribD-fused uncharacterized protein